MNSFKRREPDQKLKMQYKAGVRVSDNVSYYSYNFIGTSEPKSSLITANSSNKSLSVHALLKPVVLTCQVLFRQVFFEADVLIFGEVLLITQRGS